MPVPPMATVAISVAIVMSPMVMVVVVVMMVVMMVVVVAAMVTVGHRRRWKSERSGNCNSKRKFS
jgi:hypothetical protein